MFKPTIKPDFKPFESKKFENYSKKFENTLDKVRFVCYNGLMITTRKDFFT